MRRSRYNKTLIRTNVSSSRLVVVVVMVAQSLRSSPPGCSAVEAPPPVSAAVGRWSDPSCLSVMSVKLLSIVTLITELDQTIITQSGLARSHPPNVPANYLQKSTHIDWYVKFLSSHVNDCLIRSQFSRVEGSKWIFNEVGRFSCKIQTISGTINSGEKTNEQTKSSQ